MDSALEPASDQRKPAAGRKLRILTYNVRRCLGIDGVISPSRIAEVIAECEPDIIALQELDVRRQRSGGVDQAEVIARELGVSNVYFHPSLRVLEEEYGDALLTFLPSRLVKAGLLPGLTRRGLEPRGALWAQVAVDGLSLQVINTHFGIPRLERKKQAEFLLGPEWLGHPTCTTPVVLAGDLNSFPRRRVHSRISTWLKDAHLLGARDGRPKPTFPSRLPMFRIDHVFVSDDIEVVSAGTVRTKLSNIASDHLPLLCSLRLSSGPRGGVAETAEARSN